MELMKVCRICLIVDVKLHDLRSYPLECYYESVIGTNPEYATLPPFACFECAALVRKFYFFRQKCLRSHAVLFGTINDYGKLKSSEIRLINRKDLHIISNLSITTLPDLEICQQHKTQIKKKVKCEPNGEIKNNNENKYFIGDHNYATSLIDPSPPINDNELTLVDKEMKSENKDSQLQMEDLKETSLEFPEGEEDLEYTIDVPEVIEKMEKPKLCGLRIKRKHKKELLNPNAAECKSDFAKYIAVITLSLEEQKEEIIKRKESANYLYATFQCNLCYKGFVDNDAWDHHVRKHSESAGSIECEVCKIRFKTKHAYCRHASNHEKKYVCKLCPYVSTSMAQAKQHQGWHKGITYKCKYCDEVFIMWTSYMSHMRIKHPSEFICSYCGYSFVSKLGLAMHKTMMHKDVQEKTEANTEEGPYCEECDVKFISTEAYKRHMVMSVKHTKSTEIKGCRTCGATFENPEEFRRHRKEHARLRPKNYAKKPNPNSRRWPAKCEHCPEEFPNAFEYRTHFRRAHPDKNYPVQKNYMCDICGKSFRGNAFLVYHRRTHFEERAYKCSQCDKAFFNRHNLVLHEKTHSDNRPYPCTVCFKAFKCKGALTRHVQSHTGEKPYECEICGKKFTQTCSKKLHVRTVHMKQPAPRRNRLRRRTKEPVTQQFIY